MLKFHLSQGNIRLDHTTGPVVAHVRVLDDPCSPVDASDHRPLEFARSHHLTAGAQVETDTLEPETQNGSKIGAGLKSVVMLVTKHTSSYT